MANDLKVRPKQPNNVAPFYFVCVCMCVLFFSKAPLESLSTFLAAVDKFYLKMTCLSSRFAVLLSSDCGSAPCYCEHWKWPSSTRHPQQRRHHVVLEQDFENSTSMLTN